MNNARTGTPIYLRTKPLLFILVLELLGRAIRQETEIKAIQIGKVKVKSLSYVQLFATPWTAAYQAPPSMGFSRLLEWGAIAFIITI